MVFSVLPWYSQASCVDITVLFPTFPQWRHSTPYPWSCKDSSDKDGSAAQTNLHRYPTGDGVSWNMLSIPTVSVVLGLLWLKLENVHNIDRNMYPPWNWHRHLKGWWLEDEFPFGMAYFQRRTVSFGECSIIVPQLSWKFHEVPVLSFIHEWCFRMTKIILWGKRTRLRWELIVPEGSIYKLIDSKKLAYDTSWR